MVVSVPRSQNLSPHLSRVYMADASPSQDGGNFLVVTQLEECCCHRVSPASPVHLEGVPVRA